MAITEMRPSVIAVRPRGQRGLPGAPGAPGDQINFGSRIDAAATMIDSSVTYLRTAGYATIGDGGSALYTKVASAPSLGGFQSADGAYWEYVAEGEINVVQFGAQGDDMTPCDEAFDAAWAQLNASGCGCIYFPAGVYRFVSKVVKTLQGDTGSVKICGDGPRATNLHFPNANSGIRINQGNHRNSITLEGFCITTGQAGLGGIGLDLYSEFVIIPTSTWNYIENVMVHGDDYGNYGFANWWSVAIRIHVWGQFNIQNVNTSGRLDFAQDPTSTGLLIEGDATTSKYGILYNLNQCSFSQHLYAFTYGDWIQGVTFNECNFNTYGPSIGIISGSGYTGLLSQLALTNCQFATGSRCIDLQTGVYDLQAVNCIFSTSGSNAVGLNLPQAVHFNLVGNKFYNYDKVNFTNTIGLSVGGTGTCGTVVGNTFSALALGYVLQVGTNNVSCVGNAFVTTDVHFVNSGTSQTPGVAETGHTMP